MKEISLGNGYVALVDDEDYDNLCTYKWYVHDDGRNLYATRNTISGEATKRSQVLMHRQILNAPDGVEVDHRGHNGLDNRRSKIRLCSKAQNQHNARRRADNKSGYKGVSLTNNPNRMWQSQIRVNGAAIYLGSFFCLIKAAKTYDEAARRHFGEFANTNFAL